MEPTRICVFRDMSPNVRLWTHEVGMSALNMKRTLILNPVSLPGMVYTELNASTDMRRNNQRTVLDSAIKKISGINNLLQERYIRCKKKIKKKMISKVIWRILQKKKLAWIELKLNELRQQVTQNIGSPQEELVRIQNIGRKSATIFALTTGTVSIAQMNEKMKGTNMEKASIRRLKAGQIRNLKINNEKLTRSRVWNSNSTEEKKKKICCTCEQSGVQDAFHMLFECAKTRSIVNHANTETKKSIRKWQGQKQVDIFTAMGDNEKVSPCTARMCKCVN